MDPDPEAEQQASQMFKTAIISVVLTTCYYTSETSSFSFSPPDPPERERKTSHAKLPAARKKKTIYLTFDDGPNHGTRKVLHIANEEQVPVSFFIVGEHIYGTHYQQQTLDSLKASPMAEICNHSYTHAHNHYALYYESPDSVVKDFERCRDSLQTGNNICRTPGRNIWRTSSINSTDLKQSTAAGDSLQSDHFSCIGWDLEWHYEPKTLKLENDSDSLMNQIDSAFAKGRMKNKGHLVLLAHDQVYEDADDSSQLRALVIKLKSRGDYDLEFISNYPR